MISDGIMPSNEGRGYVLRRLIRRAARHGRILGIDGKFLAKLSETVIEGSKDGYPELDEKKDMIFKVLTEEENKFNKTIDQGLSILSELEEEMKKNGTLVLAGEDAFKLYDTYGFPIDLTREILEEKGMTIDEDGFSAAMQKQKETARSRRAKSNYMGADVTVYEAIDPAVTSEFVGYDRLEEQSEITVLTTDTELVQALADGDMGTVIVNRTPFYATMGGQEADTGIIRTDSAEFMVEDTVKLLGGKIGHVGRVTKGMFRVGDKVTLSVNEENRLATCKNHSATHLLQKALKMVLGGHVEQAGSLVNGDRLRFDFTHFQAMTPEEIQKVEAIVNEKIAGQLPVETKVMSLEDAKKTGAMALFGEKYGETVRVVNMSEFSKEFCGGTHVNNTGAISMFKIISENGVAAGVRRLEALTGTGVIKYYSELEQNLESAAKAARTDTANLTAKIESLQEEIKALHSENESLKSKLANNSIGDVMNQVEEVNGIQILAAEVPEMDMNGLRNLGDSLKEKLNGGVVVLASAQGGDKVNLMVMADDAAVKAGVHAGNIVKAIAPKVGGGGGGRPNMAQAGGKNPDGIPEALAEAKSILKK